MVAIAWKILFVVANAIADLSWALAKRFGSKAWGGVEGAYHVGRRLRAAEYAAWLPRYQAAVKSASAGDLDDSAFAVAKGHGRYEVEEYHVEDNLWEALRLIDAGQTSDARVVIESQVRILRAGRP